MKQLILKLGEKETYKLRQYLKQNTGEIEKSLVLSEPLLQIFCWLMIPPTIPASDNKSYFHFYQKRDGGYDSSNDFMSLVKTVLWLLEYDNGGDDSSNDFMKSWEIMVMIPVPDKIIWWLDETWANQGYDSPGT